LFRRSKSEELRDGLISVVHNNDHFQDLQVQHPTVLIRPFENDISPVDSFRALVRAVTRHL